MKKIGILLVIAIFVGGGTMAGIPHDAMEQSSPVAESSCTTTSHTFSFTRPRVTQDRWLQVSIDDCTTIRQEGTPMLPYTTHTMTFPIGTSIDDVKVTLGNIEIRQLDGTVAPAPQAVPLNMHPAEFIWEKGSIYESSKLYPDSWLHWQTGAGLHHNTHVVFLTLQAYPTRYVPQANMLHTVDSIHVEVSYTPPTTPMLTADDYDLLIITPRAFRQALQPLIDHKNSQHMSTKLVTTREVYRGAYFSIKGRDNAEQIKYFIRNALEEWGINYVMLVGGRHGGLIEEKWWIPVRYSHLDDGSDEKRFLSDLYFADIYRFDGNGVTFASWDKNGNGVFAEWNRTVKERLDMYPDVYVGRLACRNRYEVESMVEKTIIYETNAEGGNWARRFVGIAGDTYPDIGNRSYYEGELATQAAFNYLEGYQAHFVWTSSGALGTANDVVDAFSQGAGFVHFSGHGTPVSWATHNPQSHSWIGIDISQLPDLNNEGKFPITIVGGCHNNQFNVSVLNLLKLRNIQNVFDHSEWAPECWGWWLTRKVDGGAIATIANTGYGYGQPGEECLEKRGRYMEIMFFKSYAEGNNMLGAAHAQGQTAYLHTFPPMEDRIDCKIVQEWTLLGDPSLKIGGYP